ncbi:MAG TPA: hypothetical protein VI461_09880, partial [Chitinophagaceae bacterium]|nr:hypothetical protein [Chitinophagaceae bacterium]
MKKNPIGLFLLACAITSVSFAQTSDIAGDKLQSVPANLNFASENSGTQSSSGPILLNDINIKALRDFMTSYKNPTDVRWTILAEGFRVHFYVDGIQIRIFYNKKGNREAMIRYYSEDKLPKEIRHLVKSNYYDFDIFIVTEVSI